MQEQAGSADCRVVYVDLDGTLINTDMLWESLAATLRRAPWRVLALPFWLLRGRAFLKAKLASLGQPDVKVLPVNAELLEYLKGRAAAGCEIVLATAAAQSLAQAFANHMKIFARVLTSSDSQNLKGAAKAKAIQADSAGRPWAYCGDSSADLAVWSHAAEAVVVSASSSVERSAASVTRVVQTFPYKGGGLKAYIKAVRVYQWLKNALVFVPLIAAHIWTSPSAILAAVSAFFAFSLCASGIYLVNDLVDLDADRMHPRKRFRPMAAGTVPLSHAMVLAPILVVAGLAIAGLTSLPLLGITALYLVCTSVYSFGLKTFVLADAIMLGGLYTLRILGGAVAVQVVPSFWLLAFSMSMFLSLALIKRCSELGTLASLQRESAEGRDYRVADYTVLQSIGVSSGLGAVLVFALFVNSEHVAEQYSRPYVLWLLCGTILYWISRMWIKTARGEMHDDPLLYAARDKTSLAIAVLSGIILFASL